MKNLTCSVLMLLVCLSVKIGYGQSYITPNNTNPLYTCPGSTSAFSVYDATPSTGSPAYVWIITKGKVNGSTRACGGGINVTWDADLNEDGKLKVYRLPLCTSAIDENALVATLNVSKFRYKSADLISGGGGCNNAVPDLSCGAAQNITLLFYLKSNDYHYGQWQVLNDSQCITVPAGWSVNSVSYNNQTSTSCGILNDEYTVTLSVHTDGTHAGDVKMRVKGTCPGNYGSYYGDYSTVNLKFGNSTFTNTSLASASTFCSSSASNTFSFSSSSPTTYTYTVPAGYLINGTSTTLTTTTNSITVSSPTATADGTLTVSAQSNCGTAASPLSIPLYFGLRLNNYSVRKQDINQQFYANSFGNRMSIEPQTFPDIDYFEWGYVDINGSLPPTVVNSSGTYYQDFVFDHAGTFEIYARQGNACGLGATMTTIVDVADVGGGGFGGGFLAYPNPANSVLNISQNAGKTNATSNSASKATISTATTTTKPYSYKLYDRVGKVWREGSSATGAQLSINVVGMPPATYILHIYTGKALLVKQIVVNQK